MKETGGRKLGRLKEHVGKWGGGSQAKTGEKVVDEVSRALSNKRSLWIRLRGGGPSMMESRSQNAWKQDKTKGNERLQGLNQIRGIL